MPGPLLAVCCLRNASLALACVESAHCGVPTSHSPTLAARQLSGGGIPVRLSREEMESVLTSDSLEELNLPVGDGVRAVVKAVNALLLKEACPWPRQNRPVNGQTTSTRRPLLNPA